MTNAEQGSSPLRTDSLDHVLRTTRAVRKRLDFSREVPNRLLTECVELATQAPSKRNHQHWRFVIVVDAGLRHALARHYREAWYEIDRSRHESYPSDDPRTASLPRVLESAQYLADHLHEVPVLVLPCLLGRLDGAQTNFAMATEFSSVLPAVWSFMLAARARGLGSTLTTTHLAREEEVAGLLDIPYRLVTQVGLLPVGYIKGERLAEGARLRVEQVVSWNGWNGMSGSEQPA